MSKTFCILPIIGISSERNGSYTVCGASYGCSKKNLETDSVADAHNDEFFVNLRKDLVNGVQNSNCDVCWYHESQGVESRRQKVNAALIPQNTSIEELSEKLITNNYHVNELPYYFSIRVGNLCNLKCITCNHYHSSQHEKEVNEFISQGEQLPKWLTFVDEKKQGNMGIRKVDNRIENLKSILNNSCDMEIEGGEPLLSPLTEQILDYCIENNFLDIRLRITTNFIGLSDRLIDKLVKFNNLSFWVSWDHVDAGKSRFIRYPADYQQFLSTFNKIAQHKNIKLGLSFTCSIFNIFDLPQILDYFNSLYEHGVLQEYTQFRHVFQPNYFSTAYLTEQQRVEIVNMVNDYIKANANKPILKDHYVISVLDKIETLLAPNPADYVDVIKERTRMLDLYDKTRGTNWRTMFPYINSSS